MARSRCEIVSDILETVKNENDCKKTTIIRLANLDWDMASKYLNDLDKDGFLESFEDESKGNEVFELSKKGKLLLKSLKKIRKICTIL
ncbi:hypothetical protein AKJ51_05210 [candidate division MSBL1 archaeon SCGC-AAA382A20]|uniref:ArnR1-like winged helix-turn-helix domain-containing protein n=1 Tax=candidate division MSBL1 archaeon SCGC-AAA382A20 TaxID=1698280 RepID=A0A133VFN4_9EURY|nr:hypothetical protein AKJ51_05210 [candidate division MSBL1 archaeon SCGC-AAA382A20]